MRILATIAVFLALAPTAAAACPTVTDLEDELICPTCKTTLDQSDAPVARQIKALVARRVEQCVPKQQIKDELVADFGPSVLAAPPRKGFHWLAWLLPLAGLIAAAGRDLGARLALEPEAPGRSRRGLERPPAARSGARAPARPGARAL